MKHNKPIFTMTTVAMLVSGVLYSTSGMAGGEGEIQTSPDVKVVPYDGSGFGADPAYQDNAYNAERQLEIYGGKSAVTTPRPMLELGRDIYGAGPFDQASSAFGALNPVDQQFLVYGDWQTAAAYNDNGLLREGLITTRLRLDIDYKLTSTERIHAFINPLQKANDITRCVFTEGRQPSAFGDKGGTCQIAEDFDFDTFYLEGDLGSILSGTSGSYSGLDLPFAVGRMPLLFQNGIWVDDAFEGAAFTIPSLNSPMFDISNMDFTFFAGWDLVTTGLTDRKENVNIYGVTAFIEANEGYWELGYGYSEGDNEETDDQDYHNVTVAFSKRYGGWLSNSVRMIYNFGQDRENDAKQTADGFLLLIENSLVSSTPTTLVPYFNLFAGFDKPQPLAKGNGGVLLNTGINFETDNQTGFPKLNDNANNTWGGALGVEYLFGLDQQLVVELATVQVHGDADNRTALGDQYALGVRYQKTLDKSWIFRTDAIAGFLDNDKDISGIRAEIRKKF